MKSSLVFTVSLKTVYMGKVVSKATYRSAQAMAASLTTIGLSMSEVRKLATKRRVKHNDWYLSLAISSVKSSEFDFMLDALFNL